MVATDGGTRKGYKRHENNGSVGGTGSGEEVVHGERPRMVHDHSPQLISRH